MNYPYYFIWQNYIEILPFFEKKNIEGLERTKTIFYNRDVRRIYGNSLHNAAVLLLFNANRIEYAIARQCCIRWTVVRVPSCNTEISHFDYQRVATISPIYLLGCHRMLVGSL